MEYYFKLIVSMNDYYDSQIKTNLESETFCHFETE